MLSGSDDIYHFYLLFTFIMYYLWVNFKTYIMKIMYNTNLTEDFKRIDISGIYLNDKLVGFKYLGKILLTEYAEGEMNKLRKIGVGFTYQPNWLVKKSIPLNLYNSL